MEGRVKVYPESVGMFRMRRFEPRTFASIVQPRDRPGHLPTGGEIEMWSSRWRGDEVPALGIRRRVEVVGADGERDARPRREVQRLRRGLKKTGRLIVSGSLGWGARKLRLERGKLRVTDGPFIETKELVGGFVIIEAADFDEAVRIASLHPAARMGEELGWGIELRPMEYCELKRVATGRAETRAPLEIGDDPPTAGRPG